MVKRTPPTTMESSCVDAYGSIYAALENEVLKLEHFYPDYNFADCLYVADHEAFASRFLDADIAENGLLADTLGEPIEGLADVGDNFPDICEDDLLEITKDETIVPRMEKNDTTRDDEKDMVLKTPELDPLARILRFKTKPRAKNFKRSTPKTYDNFKSVSEVGDILLSLSDIRHEKSIDEKSSWCKLREYSDYESLDRMWNQDDDNGETKSRTHKIGTKKRQWSVSEVVKLVQGVSECGVGKWAEMHKLLFSGSHRSSVDLKDKWRNLLLASCKSEPGKVRGEYASLPDDILHQVRELSEIHPYPIPRKQLQKMKEFKTESSSSSNSVDHIWSSTSKDNIWPVSDQNFFGYNLRK